MNLLDYIVLGIILIITVCIAVWLFRRKKQRKSGCGCCAYRKNCVEGGKSCEKVD